MKIGAMTKVILKFLDTKYPDAFVKQTIFGNLTTYGDDYYISTNRLSVELCRWFDVTHEIAKHTIQTWESTLPVVVSMRNSTNPDVWVTDNVVVNSTTL